MRFLGSRARSGALAFFEAGWPGWVSLFVLQASFYWGAFLGALSRVFLSWFSVMLLPVLRLSLFGRSWLPGLGRCGFFEWEGHMRLCYFFKEVGISWLSWAGRSFRLRSFSNLLRVFTRCADGGVFTRSESAPLEGCDYGSLSRFVAFLRIGLKAQSAVGEFHWFRCLGASCEPP